VAAAPFLAGVNRVVKALGRRRLPEEERSRHNAFLDEIARGAESSDAALWLRIRSQVRHLGIRLFSNGPTMAQMSLAAVITGAGSAVLNAAPPPHHRAWNTSTPLWIQVLITVGLFGFAFDAARSPRELHPTRFMRYTAIPLGSALVLAVLTDNVSLVPDWGFRAAFLIAAVGLAAVAAGAIRRRTEVVRWGFLGLAAGAFGTSVADGAWAVLYATDRDLLLTVGCALASFGTAFVGTGLLRVKPEVAEGPG
jgi:hypothetical protein